MPKFNPEHIRQLLRDDEVLAKLEQLRIQDEEPQTKRRNRKKAGVDSEEEADEAEDEEESEDDSEEKPKKKPAARVIAQIRPRDAKGFGKKKKNVPNKCEATTTKGHQCTRNAKEGMYYCGLHANQEKEREKKD